VTKFSNAAQKALFRQGRAIKKADKDKGIITVSGYDVHIETVSPKPETRVTLDIHVKDTLTRLKLAGRFFVELQKVLSTYE
jgi:hypothetical protein